MRWPSRRRAMRLLLVLVLLAGAGYGAWYARKAWHRHELVGRLSATDPETVQAAAEELGDMGPFAGTAVPALIEVAQGKTGLNYKPGASFESHVAALVAALDALGKIGSAAEPAVPAILMVNDFWGSYAALQALVRIEDATGRVVPYLLGVVGDKTKEQALRVRAVVALGAMGPRADSTLPALLDLLSTHEDDRLSEALWSTAGRLKPDEASVAKAVELLPIGPADRDAYQCLLAARCFGNWGSASKPAIPVLVERAKRHPARFNLLGETVEALARIDPKWGETEAGRGLLPTMNEHSWLLRPTTFEAERTAAVSRLLKNLSVNPGRRETAAVAVAAVLDRIDPDWRARPAAEELLTSCVKNLPADWAIDAPVGMRASVDTPAVRAALLKTAFGRSDLARGRSNRAATKLLSQIDSNWGTWPEVPELLELLWEPHPDSVSQPTVDALRMGKGPHSTPPKNPPKNPNAPRVLVTDRAVPVLAAIGDQIGARGEVFSLALGAYPRYYEYSDGDLLRSDAELIYEATVARWKLGGRNRAAAEFVLRYRAADPNPMHRAGATAALARLGLN